MHMWGNYILNNTQNILGEVWSVDQAKLSFLDDFEAYPTYYDRLAVKVHLLDDQGNKTGKELWPMLYVMKTFRPKLLDLPFHSDYDSYGAHKMPYHERLIRTSNEEAADVMPDIRAQCVHDIASVRDICDN